MPKKTKTAGNARTDWLDAKTDTPLIGQYAERLGTFLEAMADGRIDNQELKDQEARVVALMKAVEPNLDDKLHEKMTQLLCEISAYNIMNTMHQLIGATPKTKFRG